MVSPADGWEDVEDGYEQGHVGVYVEPIYLKMDERASFERSAPEEHANAYAVSIIEDLGTSAEKHRVMTRFEDQRPAWELAHILTRYIDYSRGPMVARGNLSEEAHSDEGGFPMLTESGAEEAFREALGYYEYEADEFL